MANLLNLKSKELENAASIISKKDIAIIGMAGTIADTADLDEFWNSLLEERDFIEPLSEERKRSNRNYLKYISQYGIVDEDSPYLDGAYFKDIYGFDYEFFSMSKAEANLTEPSQRKFTQVALQAVEEAGYGGDKLKGSKTGVFVGYSDDFYDNYRTNVLLTDSNRFGLSLVGNIKSVVASRIAYFLDLKGPCMTIDTACSSSLLAIKEACAHLIAGECNCAIAGGVKIVIAPIKANDGIEVKIQSDDCRARTFDDAASGTGMGEGAVAFVLKPLYKALEDGDHVHAVIKGYSVNQDGNSVGLTVPNPDAQEDLCVQLLEKTKINPEKISFVEAHGTGTKLGDPIEVTSLSNVFSKYTEKKQYCAISSVKTSIGHLDCLSGAAGLAKVVYSLKNRVLPSHLHFNKLNRNISLVDSPFYIPDMQVDLSKSEKRLRAVINSFGLSGTNVQLLVEEAPVQKIKDSYNGNHKLILTVSAKNTESYAALIDRHIEFLESHDVSLEDYSYTANTGRGHYNIRGAVIYQDKESLIKQLKLLRQVSFDKEFYQDDNIYFGRFKICSERNASQEKYDVSLAEIYELNKTVSRILKSEDDIQLLCENYVKGADVDWEEYYQGTAHKRISLPVYPFKETLCSVFDLMDMLQVDLVSESEEECVYKVDLSCKQWFFKEHLVGSVNVMPGTVHVEIMNSIGKKYFQVVEIRDLFFYTKVELNPEEQKSINVKFNKKTGEIVLKNAEDGYDYSKAYLAEGRDEKGSYQVGAYILESDETIEVEKVGNRKGFVSTGPRWDNLRTVYIGKDFMLGKIHLENEFAEDLENYDLHPAMLDIAVNLGKERLPKGNYLPFSYQSIRVFNKLPDTFYTLIRRSNISKDSNELSNFDITLLSEENEVLIEITNYSIKRVHDNLEQSEPVGTYSIVNVEKEFSNNELIFQQPLVVIKNDFEICNKFIHILDEGNIEYVTVEENLLLDSDNQMYSNMELKNVIYFGAYLSKDHVVKSDEFITMQEQSIQKVLRLLDILRKKESNDKKQLRIVGNAYERPETAVIYGIGKVLNQELLDIDTKIIDIDETSNLEEILPDICSDTKEKIVLYRKGKRFIQQFSESSIQESEEELKISSQGTYVITGGTGGIGLVLCEWLASKKPNAIILLSRNGSVKSQDAITKLDELRVKSGVKIDIVKCDVSDTKQCHATLSRIREEYGTIRGVFHCAGGYKGSSIKNSTVDNFMDLVKPKACGLVNIDSFFEEEALDFLVCMSTITTLTAEFGQAAYVSANLFLNLFCGSKSKLGKRYYAINWPTWHDTGMAVDLHVNDQQGIMLPISNEDAVAVLDKVLTSQYYDSYVGKINTEVLKKFKDDIFIDFSDEILSFADNDTEQVNVNVIEEIDSDDIEKKVAEIWGKVLDISNISVYDSFSNIGGDSILAVKLLREINKVFHDVLEIGDIYTYNTISSMAEYIREKQKQEDEKENESDSDLLDDILDKLASGDIDLSNVESLLNK